MRGHTHLRKMACGTNATAWDREVRATHFRTPLPDRYWGLRETRFRPPLREIALGTSYTSHGSEGSLRCGAGKRGEQREERGGRGVREGAGSRDVDEGHVMRGMPEQSELLDTPIADSGWGLGGLGPEFGTVPPHPLDP